MERNIKNNFKSYMKKHAIKRVHFYIWLIDDCYKLDSSNCSKIGIWGEAWVSPGILNKHLTNLHISIISRDEVMVSIILNSCTDDTYAVNGALDIWEPWIWNKIWLGINYFLEACTLEGFLNIILFYKWENWAPEWVV